MSGSSAAVVKIIILLSASIFLCVTSLLSVSGDGTGEVRRVPAGPAQRHESFAQVWVRSVGSAEECHSQTLVVDCLTALHEDQLAISEVQNGSSVVIHHDISARKTYVVTAHHVCVNSNLQREMIKIGRYGIPTIIRYLWSTVHELVDIDGRRHAAQIFHLDQDNDMCVLSTPGTWGQVAPLAEREPILGETVYGISAPEGLFAPHMVPIFSGMYSGRSTGRVPSHSGGGMVRSEIDVYTFTSRPGSSGSGVFNQDGDLIGIVHSTVVNVSGVSIASTPRSLARLYSAFRQKIRSERSGHAPRP